MVLDHAVGGAQAQAGALANHLSSVKGIEHAVRLADARAGIEKLDYHFLFFATGDHHERAAARFLQRVCSVADDFQAALDQLIAVAPHRCQIRGNVLFYLDALAFQAQGFHLYRADHH